METSFKVEAWYPDQPGICFPRITWQRLPIGLIARVVNISWPKDDHDIS